MARKKRGGEKKRGVPWKSPQMKRPKVSSSTRASHGKRLTKTISRGLLLVSAVTRARFNHSSRLLLFTCHQPGHVKIRNQVLNSKEMLQFLSSAKSSKFKNSLFFVFVPSEMLDFNFTNRKNCINSWPLSSWLRLFDLSRLLPPSADRVVTSSLPSSSVSKQLVGCFQVEFK